MAEKEIYSDEVILILTNGIGSILGRAIRFNYYELKEKLLKSVPYHKDFTREDTQIAIDIIALSIFHQAVVVPFYGSSNFLGRLADYEVTAVRMGTYTLSPDDYNNMNTCTKAFYAILKRSGLTPSSLSIPSIEDLIENIKNPPMDMEEEYE